MEAPGNGLLVQTSVKDNVYMLSYDRIACSKKTIPDSRLKCKTHTQFLTKTARKQYPLGPHVPYIAHIREHPGDMFFPLRSFEWLTIP